MDDDSSAGAVVVQASEDAGWEDPPPRPARDAAPVLSVAGFEGPIDWLLETARAQKIDLARLPILALITAFATTLEIALTGRDQAVPLGRWGDWLVMAATLTLLRSRLLVPADAAGARAAEDEADRLRRQLLDRAATAAAADWLERRPQLQRDVFARGQVMRSSPGRVGDITGLLRACLALIVLPEGKEPYRASPPPVWRVTDAIARIGMLLSLVPEAGSPLAAFLPPIDDALPEKEFRCRTAVATTFLAGLELARAATVTLDQPQPWASIQLQLPRGGINPSPIL